LGSWLGHCKDLPAITCAFIGKLDYTKVGLPTLNERVP
jgi:hypothetical protein